tara:strand:- start:121 stop:546 length:426 start_codon:yes stop_codon:yes gene_type:complete
MADDVASSLQKGLRTRLRAFAGVAAEGVLSIRDQPAQNVALPYLRFGRMDIDQDHTDTGRHYIVTFVIEAHTRPARGGKVEAQRILGAVVTALERAEDQIPVTGYDLSAMNFLTSDVRRQDDGKTHIGEAVFEARLDAGDF